MFFHHLWLVRVDSGHEHASGTQLCGASLHSPSSERMSDTRSAVSVENTEVVAPAPCSVYLWAKVLC